MGALDKCRVFSIISVVQTISIAMPTNRVHPRPKKLLKTYSQSVEAQSQKCVSDTDAQQAVNNSKAKHQQILGVQ